MGWIELWSRSNHILRALFYAALEKQVEEAKVSDAKTQAAMVELGKLISSSAATAPALLRSAKKSLDDKQLALVELQSAHDALKIEAATYTVRFAMLPSSLRFDSFLTAVSFRILALLRCSRRCRNRARQ